ncbi:8-oxo-dGTP diphosphatase [Mycetocola zhadangensis]|uniref:Oxidized purine nucleoside triphosphate hydrolase n=1 Tax=Mycetocola zhadangensis TaxID=1164595 RepID=A0A3L7J6E3_9MICO|nr:8-oxo-dGTP diphosphatase [Mycetocola zhadangensis]RLQ84072.1 8-oxo-dGTP diphosphatase [Mycetocola zhadangensis]GGE96412.1 8-oxo-dGTP diphosphatase [Mycetocola zhadangensis]
MTENLRALPEVCVCYILSETPDAGYRVLLGEKKKGLGSGRLVGPGGKLEPGETPEQAAVREVLEESGLRIHEEDLIPLGRIRYEFPHREAWSQISWVFAIRSFHGDIVESDELLLDWVPVNAIPFDRMWDDARFWLPGALAAPGAGDFIARRFVFGPDLATVVDSDGDALEISSVRPESRV